MGFSHAIDRKDATQAQKKCLHLDYQATNIFFQSMDDSIFSEVMDLKSAHEIWVYLNEKYGAVSDDDDDHKEKVHECVKHDHNLMIVEYCSTSWSSDDDDRSTTSLLDKIDDDDASSDADDDATPCTLDGDDDGSCSDDIATTSSPTYHIASCHKVTPRYLMLMWLIMLIHMMSLLVDLLA